MPPVATGLSTRQHTVSGMYNAICVKCDIFCIYRQVSNISRTLVDSWIVDHSDVVGAPPVGAAPTIQLHLHSPSNTWLQYIAQTTSSRDVKHLSFGMYIYIYIYIYILTAWLWPAVRWKLQAYLYLTRHVLPHCDVIMYLIMVFYILLICIHAVVL